MIFKCHQIVRHKLQMPAAYGGIETLPGVAQRLIERVHMHACTPLINSEWEVLRIDAPRQTCEKNGISR